MLIIRENATRPAHSGASIPLISEMGETTHAQNIQGPPSMRPDDLNSSLPLQGCPAYQKRTSHITGTSVARRMAFHLTTVGSRDQPLFSITSQLYQQSVGKTLVTISTDVASGLVRQQPSSISIVFHLIECAALRQYLHT